MIIQAGFLHLQKRIVMQESICSKKPQGIFYHGERYIGIDRRIPDLPQVEMIRGDRVLDGEVSAFFQHYRETVFSPKQSGAYPEINGKEQQDTFDS